MSNPVDPLESLLSLAQEQIPGLSALLPNAEEEASKHSLIHSGDTDSSDDEDNRDFENRKYNESGRNIKHLLDSTTPSPSYNTSKPGTNKPSWKTKPVLQQPVTKSQTNHDAMFGIRIVNPLISSTVMEDRMVGREVVLFSKMKAFVQSAAAEKDWVIVGVIVHKTVVKVSQNGKNYFMWTLSDLKTELKTATVLMFSSACRELWKTTVGTVVGILNPSILDLREGSRDEACLSVNNHQRVMILGQSKDLGTCKSVKKGGEKCTAFVNSSICEFCIYHVKQEYQKCSKRSDLAGAGGRGLTALRNKVLGKDQVFYAGKLYTAIKNKKQTAKDQKRLNALAGLSTGMGAAPKQTQKQKQAARLELSAKERQRDLERLKLLGFNADLNFKAGAAKFNAGLSRDVSAEDSKSLAMDVISKLKKSQEKGSSSGVTDPARLQQLGVTSDSDLDTRAMKFDAELSRDVTVKASKNLALDVISKLKKNKDKKVRANSKNEVKNNGCTAEHDNESTEKLQENKTKKKANVNDLKYAEEIDLEDDPRTLWNAQKLQKNNSQKKREEISFNIDKPPKNSAIVNTRKDSEEIDLEDDPRTLWNAKKSASKDRKLSKDFALKESLEKENLKELFTEHPKLHPPRQSTEPRSKSDVNNHNSSHVDKLEVQSNQKADEKILDQKESKDKLVNNRNVANAKSLSHFNNVPFLSGSVNSKIDLTMPFKQKQATRAKQKAVKLVQSNGPIKKQDPNSTRGTATGKKRALEALGASAPDPKKAKIQDNEFFSERFKKMMAVTSNHMDLLEQHDNEEQEKYFHKLEMKERMEEKMLSTYKVPCKAVKCLVCKYTNFSASELCKTERHPLKVFDAVKRFFKCGDCGNRTACLTVVPTLSCKNCKSGKWVKTSMMKERRVEIAAPRLSIRGGEQKFVNSVASNANLDLMVPE